MVLCNSFPFFTCHMLYFLFNDMTLHIMVLFIIISIQPLG